MDRENVVKGLECCKLCTNDDPFAGCNKCPYDTTISVQECRAVLCADTLELIKEQQAEIENWIEAYSFEH